MFESLRDLLVAQCRGFLQKLDMVVREDVYAFSLYVDTGDTTAPELVLQFQYLCADKEGACRTNRELWGASFKRERGKMELRLLVACAQPALPGSSRK